MEEYTVKKLTLNEAEVAEVNKKLDRGDLINYLDHISVLTFNSAKGSTKVPTSNYTISSGNRHIIIDLEGNLKLVSTTTE